jgi:hypothetical protein
MGRLSMWRAYGGDAGVALVLNTRAFLGDIAPMGVWVTPVRYTSEEDFLSFFSAWADRLLRKEATLCQADRDNLKIAFYTRFRA